MPSRHVFTVVNLLAAYTLHIYNTLYTRNKWSTIAPLPSDLVGGSS